MSGTEVGDATLRNVRYQPRGCYATSGTDLGNATQCPEPTYGRVGAGEASQSHHSQARLGLAHEQAGAHSLPQTHRHRHGHRHRHRQTHTDTDIDTDRHRHRHRRRR
eukprot:1085378-Rhodomonas_salina.1